MEKREAGRPPPPQRAAALVSTTVPLSHTQTYFFTIAKSNRCVHPPAAVAMERAPKHCNDCAPLHPPSPASECPVRVPSPHLWSYALRSPVTTPRSSKAASHSPRGKGTGGLSLSRCITEGLCGSFSRSLHHQIPHPSNWKPSFPGFARPSQGPCTPNTTSVCPVMVVRMRSADTRRHLPDLRAHARVCERCEASLSHVTMALSHVTMALSHMTMAWRTQGQVRRSRLTHVRVPCLNPDEAGLPTWQCSASFCH